MECPICYTSILDNQVRTLSCSHVFHDACIESWITSQTNSLITPSCPYCRCNTITDIEYEEQDDLPPLIPYSVLFPSNPNNNELPILVPIVNNELSTMINTVKIDAYIFLLSKLYSIIIQNNMDYTLSDSYVTLITYYRQNYSNVFANYIRDNTYAMPILTDDELNSLNISKNISSLHHVNWWIEKSSTLENNSECNNIIKFLACCHALDVQPIPI